MQCKCILNARYFLKMHSIRNFQAFHPIVMSILLKVSLKCSSPPITVIPANFALILYPQSMQFIKPIRNWLPIKSQGKIFRIIHWFLLIRIYQHLIQFLFHDICILSLHFRIVSWLFLPYLIYGIMDYIANLLLNTSYVVLYLCDFLFLLFAIFFFLFFFCIVSNSFLSITTIFRIFKFMKLFKFILIN